MLLNRVLCALELSVIIKCIIVAAITARYKVTKYPTLKIFRYGAVSRREYRGQRSVDAIVGYVHDMLLKTIVHKLDSVSAVDSLDVSSLLNIQQHLYAGLWNNYCGVTFLCFLQLSKKHIIGYIPQETSSDIMTLTRVAAQLHDDCQFNVLTGWVMRRLYCMVTVSLRCL